MSDRIEKFTDLIVWQEAHKLAVLTYKITKSFPKEEIYGITSQIRRAVVSVTSNIAEGFGRKTMKDKIHFYTIAKGSLNEALNQFMISKDINYLNQKEWIELEKPTIIVGKILNGLISKSNSFI